jgi:hypothetical protein
MPFNLLLLPLLGGFLFIRRWNVTKFETLRSENERLLLLSSAYGVLFLIISFSITAYTQAQFPDLLRWWNKTVPFPYMGTSLLALALGYLSGWPLNWYHTRGLEISRQIEENGDRFELLLKKAMDEEKMVSVSLKSGKAYAGFVQATLNPANRVTSVGILPMRSGYRDNATRELIFTTEYAKVFDQMVNEFDEKESQVKRFRAVLKEATSRRERQAAKLDELSDEARTDQIIPPKTPEAQGELDQTDEEIQHLHAEIVRLEDRMDKIAEGLDDYETIIPVDEICILSIYDHDLYQQYFESQRGAAAS